MYKPTKQWQKLEKILNNGIIENEYYFGEEKYVKDIIRISKLKFCKPWLLATKYPTERFSKCFNNRIKFDDNFCSCPFDEHAKLFYTIPVKNTEKQDSWD